MKKTNHKGFTLIELLVVIAIIGVLSTLAVVALGNARVKSRDAKRVSDVRQVQSALELFYNDAGFYPTFATPGTQINYGTTVFMSSVPSNPSPNNDGDCDPNVNYAYTSIGGDTPTTYTIDYCVGGQIGDVAAGTHTASPAGLGN